MVEPINFDNMPQNETIMNAMLKCRRILERHERVMVSISGGSDSDIMLDMIERCKCDRNVIDYVFFDTGIEFDATKRHLVELEEKYGIVIKREKPEKTVPAACKIEGQPFLTKTVSENIQRLQKHKFDFNDKSFEENDGKFGRCASALKWWTNANGEGSQFNIERRSWLKEFMLENPIPFKVSNKCCTYAKKDLAKKYKKEHSIDLSCQGIRRAEGGQRKTIYKDCFTEGTGSAPGEFRPIYWLTDADKAIYKEFYGITYSDCYEVYGMKRTGCTGCPYARDFRDELAIVDKYEPKLSTAIRNIFKDTYAYQEAYFNFRDKMKEQHGGYMSYEGKKE